MNTKLIIAVDGANHSGKTTFVKLFERYSKATKSFSLKPSKLVTNRNWWFYDSSPEEFIDELLLLVKNAMRKSYRRIIE